MEKKSFFEGNFGKYLLPGVVLQSVLIGGGYATGREIVEYGAKFGAMGWLAGIGTFIGFALVAILSFELIRLYKAYDYKSFIKEIAGPLWVVFDVVYILFMIVIIAVMASATGSIVEQTLGLNYWMGVVGIIVVVGVLNFYGEHLIERFETFGTIALYVGYIIFARDTSYVSDASIPTIIWTGILYCAYNLVVVPASFFTLKRQTKRKEAVISGLIAGVLMTIPWFLTYFAVMCYYPNESVLGASVPWLAMMQGVAGPVVISLFGIVMGWTLIETSTGIIHALIERVNNGLSDMGKKRMTRPQQAVVTFVVLIGAMIFSKIGIIDLIAKFYNALAYAFIAIYLLPLLTVGVYKIIKKSKEETEKTTSASAKAIAP